MARKTQQSTGSRRGEDSSWHSRIPQSTVGGVSTTTARLRRLRQALKLVCGAALLFAVIFGLVRLLDFLRSSRADELLGSGSEPLRRVYFDSDGVLNQAWIERTINIAPGTALMAIDIHAIQEQLSGVGQIRSSVVERKFPDALFIQIRERDPFLRLVLQEPGGRRSVRLVSRQGFVYRGQNYEDESLKNMLYVAGVRLRADGAGGYMPIAGIRTVGEFVDRARLLVPDLYANWNYIDLSHYEGDPQAIGSDIRVRTRGGAEIIFAPKEFDEQFARLREIVVNRLNDEQKQRLKLIDLSLPDPVVRLADRRGESAL